MCSCQPVTCFPQSVSGLIASVEQRTQQRVDEPVRSETGYEVVKVTFEKPFTSKDSRGKGKIPLVCLGTSEHAVYVMW